MSASAISKSDERTSLLASAESLHTTSKQTGRDGKADEHTPPEATIEQTVTGDGALSTWDTLDT